MSICKVPNMIYIIVQSFITSECKALQDEQEKKFTSPAECIINGSLLRCLVDRYIKK